MTAFVNGIQFEIEQCCNCGIAFAMTADFQRRRREDRESFYCPAGHGQHYTGKTEAQKLKEELERKQAALVAERGRAVALEAQRDQISKAHRKMRERVRNGVCPCCTRTFQNLMQHMRTEHPDFATNDLKVLRDAFGLTQRAVADEIGIPTAYVSKHERGGSVPAYAKESIDSWVDRNSAVRS
jgi:DNA-binding transcriptional regulator YiaG